MTGNELEQKVVEYVKSKGKEHIKRYVYEGNTMAYLPTAYLLKTCCTEFATEVTKELEEKLKVAQDYNEALGKDYKELEVENENLSKRIFELQGDKGRLLEEINDWKAKADKAYCEKANAETKLEEAKELIKIAREACIKRSKTMQYDCREYCPYCEMFTGFNLKDIDKDGKIECEFCGKKIHACSVCAVPMNNENCGQCGDLDKNIENKWRLGV